MRLGYACINMELQASKPKITCNRGMIRRTFDAKGLPYASELALQNVKDLSEIIKWNHAHSVEVFRMTSCLFPWASEYQLEQLERQAMGRRGTSSRGRMKRARMVTFNLPEGAGAAGAGCGEEEGDGGLRIGGRARGREGEEAVEGATSSLA